MQLNCIEDLWFVTFALIKTLPGDPVLSLVGERASPETIERMRREIGAVASIARVSKT